jgi:hypothetical protein
MVPGYCSSRTPLPSSTAGLILAAMLVVVAELNAVARQLNGHPRQTLGWMTPSQRLAEVLHRPTGSNGHLAAGTGGPTGSDSLFTVSANTEQRVTERVDATPCVSSTPRSGEV